MGQASAWKRLLLGLVAAGAVASLAAAASAAPSGELRNIVIILDSSGSMAARIGGESKIDAAQRVVRDLVGNMPSDMNVGLVVYGARSPRAQRDCNDIEVLQPVGPVNQAAFAAALSQAHPRGMTPIGASLQQAAAALEGRPGASTIVLVSDGGETCGTDPCAIAQDIRTRLGIDVRIHVVGFDVESSERSRLECVAQGGGGTYYPAATSDELEQALIDATRPPPARGGAGPMWLSIAHPGLGEMRNAGRGWAGLPKRKFWLGLIPGFGWPGYLQIVSAIDAAHGRTNDWLEPDDR
jgi:Ca-activated chloride channel family protein